ncbi:MAG TPA: GNAT family N-acetyltransferase [Gaiellaceae bacterium]|nr:GNAT family N-acetyltransferase [Gaiellaceae bacterium]
MNENELLRAANANFVASFRKLSEHSATGAVHERGGVFAFASGHPVQLFNGCVVWDVSTPADLDEALHWVRERHVPYRVWIAECLVAELGGVALQTGLERHPVPYPSMVLHPVPESPLPAANVTVAEVGRHEFVDTAGGLGFRHELAEEIFAPGFTGDPDVRLFTGRLDGRPVGYSIAIRSGDMSGVYAVGVARVARRRGVGTALTWAAVDAGRGWGCEAVTLQSTEMAISMYEAMGFRTAVSYAVFKEPTPIGQETPVPPSPQ